MGSVMALVFDDCTYHFALMSLVGNAYTAGFIW